MSDNPQERPNILLITTDQQRFDTIGANGNPHIRTPHLDGLADEYRRMCAAYYGMISHVDHHVGRLLERLDASGSERARS